MANLQIPNFGELLAPYLGAVSAEALPFLLSQLERTAAARYRGWAEEVTAHRENLLACAAREDEIADRVERLLPPSSADRDIVLNVMPQAKATYYAVFEGISVTDQMSIQAKAERQGAGAWQGLKASYPKLADDLDELSAIELQSADCLDEVLAAIS